MENEKDTLFSFFPKLEDDFDLKILSPLSRVKEFESKCVIEFDLPMVEKKAITVSVKSNTIIVEAKLKEKYCDENFEKCEFESFKKTITLPNLIDEKKIIANFENGRLTITAQKISRGTKISVN